MRINKINTALNWITNSQIIATIQLTSINKYVSHVLSITYTNIFNFDKPFGLVILPQSILLPLTYFSFTIITCNFWKKY